MDAHGYRLLAGNLGEIIKWDCSVNPTIGLILCAEKNDAVARYSVLRDRKQISASKYMLFLPTEEELAREIQRERRLVAEAQGQADDESPQG